MDTTERTRRSSSCPIREQRVRCSSTRRDWVVDVGQGTRRNRRPPARTWQKPVPTIPRIGKASGMIAYPTTDTGWATSAKPARILRTTDAGRTWTDVTNGAAPPIRDDHDHVTERTHEGRAAPDRVRVRNRRVGLRQSALVHHRRLRLHRSRHEVGAASPHRAPPPTTRSNRCAPRPRAGTSGRSADRRTSRNPRLSTSRCDRTAPNRRSAPSIRGPLGTIESIDFVDADHGWALVQRTGAEQRDLYSTGDGGMTWSLVLPDAPIAAPLDFTTSTHGWASSPDSGNLETTDDAGISWHGVNVPTKASLRELHPRRVVVRERRCRRRPGRSFHGQRRGAVLRREYGQRADVGVPLGATRRIARTGPRWIRRRGCRSLGSRIWQPPVHDRRRWPHLDRSGAVRGTRRDQLRRPPEHDRNVRERIRRPERRRTTVVLGTTNGGENWTTIDFSAPPMVGSGAPDQLPRRHRRLPDSHHSLPPPPGDPPPESRRRRVRLHPRPGLLGTRHRSSRLQGRRRHTTGELRQPVRLPAALVPDRPPSRTPGSSSSARKPGSGGGGSTTRPQLALAHYADGWHVFGRYH